MPIQFDPFVASQGLAAGLAGKLPEFQQTQNQKAQLDLEKQKQDDEMKIKIQESQFKDAYVAQQLLKDKNYDGIIQVGLTRIAMEKGLGVDPSNTQTIVNLATGAKNGNSEAASLLGSTLNSYVNLGSVTGVLKIPETTSYKSEVDALGVRRYTEGPDIGKPVPGFETPKPEGGGDTPASLQELAALENMTDEQKKNFWRIKNNIEQVTLPPEAYFVQGEDFLSFVPDSEKQTIIAIAEGRTTPAQLGRSKDRARLMEYVYQYDPTYDLGTVTARNKALSDFGTGKNGNIVRSMNVSINHLDTLQKAADALKNGDLQLFNRIGNSFSTQTGSPELTDFNATKQIVADEILKAVLGGPGGVRDREIAAKSLDGVNSPAQLLGVINQYKELLGGQLGGLKTQYKSVTGKDDFDKFLTESALAAYGSATNANSTATTSTTAPPTRPNPAQFDSGAQ